MVIEESKSRKNAGSDMHDIEWMEIILSL